MSITSASRPTSTRGLRRSTARRIVAAASAAGRVSSLSNSARRAAVAGGTPSPTIALRAMPVRTPPGCTQVTPTPAGASSPRSDSVNPRTANLLVQ